MKSDEILYCPKASSTAANRISAMAKNLGPDSEGSGRGVAPAAPFFLVAQQLGVKGMEIGVRQMSVSKADRPFMGSKSHCRYIMI